MFICNRMKVQIATFCASTFSALSLLTCSIVMYSIQNNVQSIWQEFDNEMNEFKVIIKTIF